MSDEDSREAWDAAWHARLDRKLPDGCKLDLSAYGNPVAVTISANPPAFAERGWRESVVCPVCGSPTDPLNLVAATLDIQLENHNGLLIGVWAHSACLGGCLPIGLAAHAPW